MNTGVVLLLVGAVACYRYWAGVAKRDLAVAPVPTPASGTDALIVVHRPPADLALPFPLLVPQGHRRGGRGGVGGGAGRASSRTAPEEC